MSYCESFPPVTAAQPKGLILGSMPGVKSLEEWQYYAHPQNAFWKIISAVFDRPCTTYPERMDAIKANDLALWDVLKACVRPGSLDSDIDPSTVEVNDFNAFLSQHKSITHIFFNGGKAEQEFMRRVLPVLDTEISERLSLVRMPSTSPAHAGMAFARKLDAWRGIRLSDDTAVKREPVVRKLRGSSL